MADMMKKLGAMGKGGVLKQAVSRMFGKNGPSEADLAAARESIAQGKAPATSGGMTLPKGFGGASPFGGLGGPGGGGLPPGLSGFGKKK